MIHPTAIIDSSAVISSNVEIGPYSIIGPNVEIDEGTWIGPHVTINGPTTIGKENKIFQYASLGEAPQDKKYDGEPTRLVIGDRNCFRESCTINRGTIQDIGVTTIGDDNWIMAYVHIAHDCIVGNNTIFANSATLAGHVTIEDYAILGGFTLVHQFCKVGAHCFTAMNSVISKDVPPFMMISGHMAKPHGLNVEGLKRKGFSKQAISELRKAYKILYRSNLTLEKAIEQIQPLADQHKELKQLSDFLKSVTRGVVR